jgi:adenine-specific DNA-methyltransferase
MMVDRISLANHLLDKDMGVFQCHIDENEYEFLFNVFELFIIQNAGTVIWNKLNPILGKKGVATQHEYIIFRSNNIEPIYANSDNINRLKEYAELSIRFTKGKITSETICKYQEYINADKAFSGGDKAYRFLDDDGSIFRLVAIGAPEKRTDPKYHIPLIHPVTKKPCPVPPNGWSRAPQTMTELVNNGLIIFGDDESIQPNKKVYLSSDSKRQLPSVLSEGKSGKADLDKLGLIFPYAHPVAMYERLLSVNDPNVILDYFAGSGTTGHAVINLRRSNYENGSRKYILVEMADYFNTVTKPRMQKVVYAKEWKDGKPLSRDTGISHLIKYFQLESYEDTLTNIDFSDKPDGKSLTFGDEYLINYMINTETKGSLLNIEKIKEPFDYRLKITEKNETKETPIDLSETFNYLIGLKVIRQNAIQFYKAVKNGNKEYEGSVDLKTDKNGDYGFKQIEGYLNDDARVLIIWRNITDNLIESNAALDAYFQKGRVNSTDREYDIIYVNGDNNLNNMRAENETWKVNLIENEFFARMFDE